MHYVTSSYVYKPYRQASFAIAKYKPFIAGLGLVLIGTYVLELARSNNGIVTAHQLMNAFMGFFFTVFSIPKLCNVSGFASTFKQYDLISQKLSHYAYAYPFIELALGIFLLSGALQNSVVGNRFVNAFVALITGLTLLGIIRSLRQKKQLDCACMGAAFKFPLSKLAVVENGAMLLMAVSMLYSIGSPHMTMISLTHLQVVNQ